MMNDMSGRDGVRLNKWIAESGTCSRREADRLIAERKVTIDGRIGVLGDKVLPGMVVRVEGREVRAKTKRQQVYIALNKPVGVVCTADPREPMNVVDYVGHPERIFPIGRLDKDSEGLLLMTSDGEIVNRILRAAGRHEKEYVVTVDKPITAEFLNSMASGVPILDTVTLPCRITKEDKMRFRIVLVQGLNRQIRRMCEAIGLEVSRLKRTAIGNVRLGTLPVGKYRELTEKEVHSLLVLSGAVKDKTE